jgi:hypothetical protein
MPKRLLDDSLLSSPSLAKCSPRAQDAFPRFLLLADDFGCFEVEPRALVGRGWPKRDDVSAEDVLAWLNEYAAAGMACLYTAQERRCCYLTGWDGPHGQKKRAEYDPNAPAGTPGRHGSKRRLPAPPADLVAAVVAGVRRDADGKPPGTDREDSPESVNDSVPAREVTGSRSVPAALPAVPGPVVPVPDVDPVPGPAAGAVGGERPAASKRVCLGPLGARVVREVAKGIGHGLVPLTATEDATALEAIVAAHGGVEDAVAYVSATCRSRDKFDPQSVKLLLDVLRDPFPGEVRA